MTKVTFAFATVLALAGLPSQAFAAEYQCKGNRVEKGNMTIYTVRSNGSDLAIEKSNMSVGNLVKRGGKHHVEVGGSSIATIENGRIEKGNSSWSTISEAQRTFDCPDLVAGTLWVLKQTGKL